MKKLALLLPVILACGNGSKLDQSNLAEIVVKAQVKDAVCHAPESVSVCVMPDKSTIISIKDKDIAWRALPYIESPDKAPAPQQSSPAPQPPAPPAPAGQGSGTAAPTK
jgi:hypothetical protein